MPEIIVNRYAKYKLSFAVLLLVLSPILVFPGCAGGAERISSSQTGSSGPPSWVINPDYNFPQDIYLAQVRSGTSRGHAEQNALAALASVFGQSLQSETTAFASYAQAIRNGSIEFDENKSLESEVITSVDMDTLLGAEIAEVWTDGSGIHYAAAVMNKQRALAIYNDLFRANQRMIDQLTSISAARKNSIYGYSGFLLAGTIADVNRVYANVIIILGGAVESSFKSGDEYRLEARDIAMTIPIAVAVNGDSSNRRIVNAFQRALNQLGFLSGGNDSDYLMDADFAITSVITDYQGNVHLRYSLTAALTDLSRNIVIVPYSNIGREGHLNEPSALDLVYRVLEESISTEFPVELKDFLSANLPRL